jgi:hypothetical protein
VKHVRGIGIAAVIAFSAVLLSSCGGTSTNSNATQSVATNFTDGQIAEILPEFDLADLEQKGTQKSFFSERTDETIPVIINYQGKITSKTPRQCLGGENPISRSFEETLLSEGWTIDALLTGDHSSTLAFQTSMMSVEVFRKSDYVLIVDCRVRISRAESQVVEGSWGSVGIKRNCIVNDGLAAQIILSFKSVPKIIMEMAGQTKKWEKISLADVDPIFLDDVWRLDTTRDRAYDEPIIDYEGIPYSYRDEYPKTPSDTNHGPMKACP